MIGAVANVWLALLVLAPEPLRLELPATGWTNEPQTQVVVSHARPDAAVTLAWLGYAWSLWPNEAGRAAAFLPLLGPRTTIAVEQPGRGPAAAQVAETGGFPDLAIVVAWEQGARFDLRVTDPEGEVCDAANRATAHGGVRLRDDPEAPGPHVFESLRGLAGDFKIALACGRLPAGRQVRVRALVFLQPGTAFEEKRDLSTVVTRCDELTELGIVQVLGRSSR